jgi:hypothetical protein
MRKILIFCLSLLPKDLLAESLSKKNGVMAVHILSDLDFENMANLAGHGVEQAFQQAMVH